MSYGGYPRSENELRIQVTGLPRPQHFEVVPGEKTLVLGSHAPTGIFAGFDVQKHLGDLGESPSIQIHKDVVESAVHQGLATQDKGNHEIAIAFREDFIGEYIRDLEALHGFAQSPGDLAQLETVIENPEINDEDIHIGDQQRHIAVSTLRRIIRDANFRHNVLRAYNNQCAMCGTQLELVQAAHIIPVAHVHGTNETRNGIALCCNHHAAFDDGLIAIQEDYSIFVNAQRIQELERRGLAGGLENFVRDLQERISIPERVQDRPHRDYIRLGNEARRVVFPR